MYSEEVRRVERRDSLRSVAGVLGVATALSACGAPPLSAKPPVVQTVARGRMWMSPRLKSANHVVFVSDVGNDTVDIFTMPSMTFVAQLTGFNEPQGDCAARNGDVWITNTINPNAIQLYSHAGKWIKSLGDYNEHPVGCAVDPSTGDLAASSLDAGSGSQAGDVAVYKRGSYQPTTLSCSSLYYYYFVAFGPKGSLYVDGVNSNGEFQLCGGNESSLSPISVSGATIYFPGFLQWYRAGNYLAAGDQLCKNTNAACVYQLSISGSTATSKGVTNLVRPDGSNVCDLTAATFAGRNQLVGTDDEWCNNNREAAVGVWNWPSGGEPIADNDSELIIPVGVAISAKSRSADSAGRAAPELPR